VGTKLFELSNNYLLTGCAIDLKGLVFGHLGDAPAVPYAVSGVNSIFLDFTGGAYGVSDITSPTSPLLSSVLAIESNENYPESATL